MRLHKDYCRDNDGIRVICEKHGNLFRHTELLYNILMAFNGYGIRSAVEKQFTDILPEGIFENELHRLLRKGLVEIDYKNNASNLFMGDTTLPDNEFDPSEPETS